MTEAETQRAIKLALGALGFEVAADTSQGYRPGGRRHATTRITKGVPDLYVRHRERRVRGFLEVKGKETRVTLEQRAWIRRERDAGGNAAIVRSVCDALWAVHYWGIPSHPVALPSQELLEQFAEAA